MKKKDKEAMGHEHLEEAQSQATASMITSAVTSHNTIPRGRMWLECQRKLDQIMRLCNEGIQNPYDSENA